MLKTNAIILALVTAFAAGCSTETSSAPQPAADPAAAVEHVARAQALAQTLPNVRDVVARGHTPKLGVSAGDVAAATAGEEIPVRYARLDQVRSAAADPAPLAALGDPAERVAVLSVGGEPRSVVTYTRDAAGVWDVSSIGRASLARVLDVETKRLSADGHAGEVSLLVVTDASMRFLAHEERGQLMLTPLRDQAQAGLARGQTAPAGAVLSRLHAQADTATP